MNPRVSRSSALASKATGFPIAKVAAKLAVGYTLDELANDITRVTPASFEPTIDYVVTKMPRFTFEKFPGAEPLLTTSMKSVGEAMAIGRSFAESVQKALRSMETGLDRLRRGRRSPVSRAPARTRSRRRWPSPTPDRLLVIAQAFRHGLTIEEIHAACHYDPLVPERDPRDRRGRGAGAARRPAAAIATGLAAAEADGLLRRPPRPSSRGIDEAEVAALRRAPRRAPGLQAHRHLRRRVRLADALHVFLLRGRRRAARRNARPIPATATRSSSSAAARTASARASSSTIAASMPPMPERGRHRDHHGQLQPGDRLDRLRHLRPALFRAADRRGRDRDRAGRAARAARCSGVIVQFGGQTPLKLAAALERGADPDPRHLARRDRPRRGPRALPAAAARLGLRQPDNGTARSPSEAEAIAERDRLSGGDPAVLCAGRPGDGDRARRRRARPLHAPTRSASRAPARC